MKANTNDKKGLREQLIGAWKLVSYIETPMDGSPTRYPMGEKGQGIIMYTPDGYMSAQLMKPGRRNFASGDWFKGTPEEYAEEGADTSHTQAPSTSTKQSRLSLIRWMSLSFPVGLARPSH